MRIFHLAIPEKRIYGLDILRALAILFVVYGHSIIFVIKVWPKKWLTIPVLDGVSIFFVLSGFLIGGILLKIFEEQKASFRLLWKFWIRRWFRTLPNYFLLLIVLFIIQGLILNKTSLAQFWPYLFFSQNLNSIHPVFFPEAWSLSVEEWFYVFIPLGLLAIRKGGMSVKYGSITLIIFFLIFSTAIRYFRFTELGEVNFSQWDNLFRKQVLTRLDSIVFGVFGAWLAYYFKSFWIQYKRQFIVLGIALMALHKFLIYYRPDLGFGYNSYYCIWSFSLISLATLLLIPFLSQVKAGSGWVYKAITKISLISYSMYLLNLSLIQEVVFRALYKVFPMDYSDYSPLLYFSMNWIFTILLSILLYKYFEIPTTKLRDRWSAKRE